MEKIPPDTQKTKTRVIVLAGFLGAGKTTLLQKMLSWETDLSDTVVIVNDYRRVESSPMFDRLTIVSDSCNIFLFMRRFRRHLQKIIPPIDTRPVTSPTREGCRHGA